ASSCCLVYYGRKVEGSWGLRSADPTSPGMVRTLAHSVNSVKSPHRPAGLRLAISGDAPALSAVTMSLLAWERKLTLPSEFLIRSNSSHGPIAVRFAIS